MSLRFPIIFFLALFLASESLATGGADPGTAATMGASVGSSAMAVQAGGAGPGMGTGDSMDTVDDMEFQESQETISDPLEPFNRAMFVINDMVYTVVIKPLAHVYAAVAPEVVRAAVRNFFHNLAMPTHFVNALLQRKSDVAGRELFRFLINSTVGVLGFHDAADQMFQLKSGDEDTGQTLGTYGIGDGVYINWPLIGPSNLRDTVGLAGDAFLNPLGYVPSEIWVRGGIQGYRHLNETSLRLGEYEDLKKAALDPYVAVRDAYLQTRRKALRQ
ncbi:MAG: VacJ family lipoprotein [Magnetococcales bacterium]|nr:VacJ family lipoprotein [Magnetococcales bacterium]